MKNQNIKSRIILATGSIALFTLAIIFSKTKFKLHHDAPNFGPEVNNTLPELDDREALETLKSEIVDFSENTDLKYMYPINEILAGKIITNKYTGSKLEDIYGDQIPDFEIIKQDYMNFLSRTTANYTYATDISDLGIFFENADENTKRLELEDALAVVNKEQMEDKLKKESINKVKGLLDEVYDGPYSVELKAYISTVYAALEHITDVPGFEFTSKEIKERKELEDKYVCAVIDVYKVAYAEALKENGAEDVKISARKAVDTYFNGTNTFLQYLNTGLASSYDPEDIDDITYRDRTNPEEYKDEEYTVKGNTTTGSTGKGNTDKDGKVTAYDKLTKEEKKEADQGAEKLDADLKIQNKFEERMGKDGAEASGNYLDRVEKYVEDETIKYCEANAAVSGKGYSYVIDALNNNRISNLKDEVGLDMTYIKEDLLKEELNAWLSKFDKRYIDLYPTTNKEGEKDKDLAEEHARRKDIYEASMTGYINNTYFISTTVDGKEMLPLTWAITNGFKNGAAKYLISHPQQGPQEDLTNNGSTVNIVVPSNQMEDAIDDVPVGQNTNMIDDNWYEYWEDGVMEDGTSVKNTTNNPNLSPTPTPTVTPAVPPVLDLTGTQTYELDEGGNVKTR